MTTTLSARRVRGIYSKGGKTQQSLRGKGSNLPEYLEQPEGQVVIASTPNPLAKPLTPEQRQADLREPEALSLENRDRLLDSDRPTLRVRRGNGNKNRVVPLHPELQTALIAAAGYGAVGQGRFMETSRTTAWRRPQVGAELATSRCRLPQSKTRSELICRQAGARAGVAGLSAKRQLRLS